MIVLTIYNIYNENTEKILSMEQLICLECSKTVQLVKAGKIEVKVDQTLKNNVK